MSLEVLKGKVTDVEKGAMTEGRIQRGGGSIDTSETVAFRIGNRAVALKLSRAFANRSVSLKEGDHVTVVGKPSDGGFSARAMRNDETQVVYAPKPSYYWGGFAAAFLMGLVLTLFVIGLAIVLASFIFIPMALNAKKVNRLLQES